MTHDDQESVRAISMDDVVLAVRMAARAYGARSFVVVGRGSLGATMANSSPELRATMDIDLFPPWQEEKAAVWAAADVQIGRRSAFRLEHGFYVERVGEWTLMDQPKGWEDRALKMRVDDIEVKVIHPLDLAYNKLEAGRDKDIAFMREGLASGAYKFEVIEGFIREHAREAWKLNMLMECLNRASGDEPIEAD